MKHNLLGLSLILLTSGVWAAETTPLTLIPLPQQIQRSAGVCPITSETRVYTDWGSHKTGQQLVTSLRQSTGYPFALHRRFFGDSPVSNAILLTTKGANTNHGPESYELTITTNAIVVRAPTQAGLFYGTRTLLQLLPPEIFSTNVVEGIRWQVPCIHIEDWPRFKWRGLMLDVSRHFYTKTDVEHLLDLMALYKLNTFHWHLTDDPGWRIQIKKYPRLTQVGAWREKSRIEPLSATGANARPDWMEPAANRFGPDGRYGGFYTVQDIHEVVAYAAARHITIVPEIEMPGHSLAALKAYPQLNSSDVVSSNNNIYCPANPETFGFLENVLSEVFRLFPGKYVHIGGDEVNKRYWESSPECRALMKREGLKNSAELQSWFIKRIEKFVNAHGKTLIGWSEILQGGLATNAVVMDWIGGGKEAASAGHDVVMTPTSDCYFDYYQSTNHATEPQAIGGFLPLKKVYSFEPIPEGLRSQDNSHILGAQGNLWTEYIASLPHAEYMIFPRLCALSEVVWSSKESRNWPDFQHRLKMNEHDLSELGVNYRGASTSCQGESQSFRPPAVPLVTIDPYLSIWSEADHLTDDATRHWTYEEKSLISLIRVDGKAYRLMGKEPQNIPAMPQVGLRVTPTRSIYEFENANVHITLTFMTPALPNDLEVLARPITYLTWTVRSTDGDPHKVSIYDSASSELTVNQADEKVEWWREKAGELTALKIGTKSQPILKSSGDYQRIDWGYLYLAAEAKQSHAVIGADRLLLNEFVKNGSLPQHDDTRMPRSVNDDEPVLAFSFDLGKVSNEPISRHVILAYDEIDSIKYIGRKLRPYWRRNGMQPAQLLDSAENDYQDLVRRCKEFDEKLMADMTQVGGRQYAQITALAYRQCLAGCGLVADANNQPLLFTKENSSNGDIATADVIYPMAPIWLFLNPTLAKASLVPLLNYAASSHWKFPHAPHDLGLYPDARGLDNGGEEMPVEESANMLILCDAIAHDDGNADFAEHWWPQLTRWAQFLEQYGLDPENQLCTDDFMGHLAHNANLSIKAILALAAYGDLCEMRGNQIEAEKYRQLVKADAQHWMKVATDGDHYRLAFDKTNTWSQKYNLVWDRILGLNVFPSEVEQQEIAFYKTVMQPYGLPLDSRTYLTKIDWSFWTATLADNRSDFESFISPIYKFLNNTTIRLPLMDSYDTDRLDRGKDPILYARPVVGGLFIKMLTNNAIWQKWSNQGDPKAPDWSTFPAPQTNSLQSVPSQQMTL